MVTIYWSTTIRCCCICNDLFWRIQNLGIECKHGISTNDIITFNETLDNLSTSVVKQTNIDDYSHKEKIVNVLTLKF